MVDLHLRSGSFPGAFLLEKNRKGIMMKENLMKFWDVIKDEIGFLLIAVAVIAVLLVIAVMAEKAMRKRNLLREVEPTKKVVLIAMFSALAGILMYLEFPIPIAPSFYEIDLLGPVAGVTTEFVKILIKLLIKGTSTAYVGDVANFIVGCAFVIPATVVFRRKHTVKNGIFSMVVGTICMAGFGGFVNAFVLLPAFAQLYGGMPVSDLIAMGTEVNGLIGNMFTFIILAVIPVNIIKGVFIGVITLPIYFRLEKVIKNKIF